MNKTTIFLSIAILLTVFSYAIAQRTTDDPTLSNTSIDNPSAVIDFSDQTDDSDDLADNSTNSIGSNAVLPSGGPFTTQNSPSTGTGALNNPMGTDTFNTTTSTTGPSGPNTTDTTNDSGANPGGTGFSQANPGGSDQNVESPTGSTSGAPIAQ
jgi:hypothetical protein